MVNRRIYHRCVVVIAGVPPVTREEEDALTSVWLIGGVPALYAVLDEWLRDGRGWNMVRIADVSPGDGHPGLLGTVVSGLRNHESRVVTSADGAGWIDRQRIHTSDELNERLHGD